MRLLFADCEVFPHDVMWGFYDPETGRYEMVWNDPMRVAAIISDAVLCGYNFKAYDQHILKATLLGEEPEDIYELSHRLVTNQTPDVAWLWFQNKPYQALPPYIDLFHDIVPMKSLKEIAANMGLVVKESSVSFDKEEPLTPEERHEIERYCANDLEVTAALFEERKAYLRTKRVLCELGGLDPWKHLRYSNAFVVASVLGAERGFVPPQETYQVPKNLRREVVPAAALEFAEGITTHDAIEGNKKIEFEAFGVPFVMGLGGLHGALEHVDMTSDETHVLLNLDVTSYYPSLIIRNGYMSRACQNREIYKRFYDLRIEAKKKGDKDTADAAKLVLNTAFGIFRSKNNPAYDPMMGANICISGQLYLLDLIGCMAERVVGFQLVQANTDGILIWIPRDQEEAYLAVRQEWEQRTGFSLEDTRMKRIVQANVNNYIAELEDGEVKCKGGWVSGWKGGDFKSCSMTIVDEAVVRHVLYGEDYRSIIEACDDPLRLQIVTKAGSTFDYVRYGEERVQKVNRIFPSKDPSDGRLVKVKVTEDGESISKIPLTPDHSFIWNDRLSEMPREYLDRIDREWYTGEVQRRLGLLKGVTMTESPAKTVKAKAKPKKEEPVEKVATEEKNEQKTEQRPVSIVDKLAALHKLMLEEAGLVQFDKVVPGINYDYADTQQYKALLGRLCVRVGLIPKLDIVTSPVTLLNEQQVAYEQAKGARPSYLYTAHAEGTISFINADNPAESITYQVSGDGVNTTPGYCSGVAQTNALRKFILDNFMLDNRGRDGDDVGLSALNAGAGNGYVSPAEKGEMRENLKATHAQTKWATPLFMEELHARIKAVREKVNPEFAKDIEAQYFEADGKPKMVDGHTLMTSADAALGMQIAEEMLAEAGAE